jgi:uncharacterized protein (DUF433 family)
MIELMATEYVEERDGGYYVAGTRVSLDSIIQCFNEGLSPEAIQGEFETLTLAQVFGTIAFYLENHSAIDAYRVRQEKRFGAVRRAAPLCPPACGNGLKQCANTSIPVARNKWRPGSRPTTTSGALSEPAA